MFIYQLFTNDKKDILDDPAEGYTWFKAEWLEAYMDKALPWHSGGEDNK